MTTYTVTVQTADRRDASSSLMLWITLYGLNGKTAKRVRLDTSSNDFETGKMDTFHIKTDRVGEIELIVLNCEGTDAWLGEWVEVLDDKTKRRFHFPIAEWMSSTPDEGKDMLIIKAR